MTLRTEIRALALIVLGFLAFYLLPFDSLPLRGPLLSAFELAQWYAREHVLTCLVPAFLIAGAIAVFISQAAVMRYLGAGANRLLAYGVASVSGSILAVCSCTILPLFAGIYRMGAGLGPATAFLYAGPAVNVLAIILTARILGVELGVARAVGAIVFAVVIGLLMSVIFRRDEQQKIVAQAALPEEEPARPMWKTVVYFALMVLILVGATWAEPQGSSGAWAVIHAVKWPLVSALCTALCLIMVFWFGLKWWKLVVIGGHSIMLAVMRHFGIIDINPALIFAAGVLILWLGLARARGELREWSDQSWSLTKQIMPLLLLGVLVAGLLMGTPAGGAGLVPPEWIARLVGGNSLGANLFASVAGALMYFATLTEVPILQGLLAGGMGNGPALALLLAGPALSLPNMLVIASVMGWKKTGVFIALVVVMATFSGWVFGMVMG